MSPPCTDVVQLFNSNSLRCRLILDRTTALNTKSSIKCLSPAKRTSVVYQSYCMRISTADFDNIVDTFHKSWYIYWSDILSSNTEFRVRIRSHSINIASFVLTRNKHSVIFPTTNTRYLNIETANFRHLVASSFSSNSQLSVVVV